MVTRRLVVWDTFVFLKLYSLFSFLWRLSLISPQHRHSVRSHLTLPGRDTHKIKWNGKWKRMSRSCLTTAKQWAHSGAESCVFHFSYSENGSENSGKFILLRGKATSCCGVILDIHIIKFLISLVPICI